MSLSKNLVSPSGSDRSPEEEAVAAEEAPAKENCQAKLAGGKKSIPDCCSCRNNVQH